LTSDLDPLLDELRSVCERIARGHYDELDELFAMSGNTDLPKVVNELAEAFSSMAVQIEAREYRLQEMLADLRESHRQLGEAHKATLSENESLRGTVAKLRIEIDQGKRDEEVAEITDTSYFQMLQSRAKELRARRKP